MKLRVFGGYLMLKPTLAALTILLLPVVLIGCGDDAEPTSPSTSEESDTTATVPAELLGEWDLESATINGINIPLDYLLSWSDDVETARLTIGKHNTYLYQELSELGEIIWSAEGVFSVSGSTFAMATDIEMLEEGSWAVADGVLTLTGATEAGYALVVTAVRTVHQASPTLAVRAAEVK